MDKIDLWKLYVPVGLLPIDHRRKHLGHRVVDALTTPAVMGSVPETCGLLPRLSCLGDVSRFFR